MFQKRSANEIQELCCFKFQGITVPEHADRKNHHFIYSSDPSYLSNCIMSLKTSMATVPSQHLSLIVGYCSILVINAQGTAICIWSTNSFTGERKVTESNSQLHGTDPKLCIGPIYDLDRTVCWQGQCIS